MKKNSLTSAIIAGVAGVAGLAGVANAVNLNPDGIGQVLLYPYYTVNGGNSTLVTVVNTADVAKAVKVRFLESLNSKEVLDFNLYLSAHDVWTGVVSEINANGDPGLTTDDHSCIAPNNVMTTPQPFLGYEFTNWLPDKLGRTAAAAAQNKSRMRQGHLEVIEMGDLGGVPAESATHINGTPKNCAYFHNQWVSSTAGTWLSEAGGVIGTVGKGLHDVYPPGSGSISDGTGTTCGATTPSAAGAAVFQCAGGPGGIFGSGIIVNGAQGTTFSYNAEAVNGFYTIDYTETGVNTDRNLHYQPGSTSPSLFNAANALDANGDYIAISRIFDAAGTPVDVAFNQSTINRNAAAVSTVLSARYVANEYIVVPGFVSSDWVVTFPTKMLHTYRSPAGSTVAAGLAPFSEAQGSGFLNNVGDNVFEGYWGEVYAMDYWDQEEGYPSEPPGVLNVSPLPPPGEVQELAFGAEANVLTFYTEGNEPTSVLAAPAGVNGGGYTVELEDGFSSGWARVAFEQSLTTDAITVGGVNYGSYTITGLPVIGFWAANFINENVTEGVMANYSIIHRHRVSRKIEVAQTAP